jgi:hypothetical protein
MNKVMIIYRRKVNLLIGVSLLNLIPCMTNAQGLIATMIEQLARLELCLQEAKQGYSIVQKGLTVIGDIKKGNLDLHNVFFNSLSTVNPAIKGYVKVVDILTLQAKILSICKSSLQDATRAGQFSKEEVTYLAAVFSHLVDLTGKDIDEVTGLTTDGHWQMTDDQRMGRIDTLYKEVADKSCFVQSFADKIALLAQQRKQEKVSLQNMEKLF